MAKNKKTSEPNDNAHGCFREVEAGNGCTIPVNSKSLASQIQQDRLDSYDIYTGKGKIVTRRASVIENAKNARMRLSFRPVTGNQNIREEDEGY